MRKRRQIETVEQYLSRGGKIQQIPTGVSGDRGGVQSINTEEMAAKRVYTKSVWRMFDPAEFQPRYGK